MLKDAQLLFSVAFHEIIRQVSVHCLERGYLMGKVGTAWRPYRGIPTVPQCDARRCTCELADPMATHAPTAAMCESATWASLSGHTQWAQSHVARDLMWPYGGLNLTACWTLRTAAGISQIWWSEMELFQRMLQLHRRSRAALESERTQFAEERSSMQARINDLEREVEQLRINARR